MIPRSLIKPNKKIDYYVLYHPRMVSAYFQCINGKCPIEPLGDNIEEHIQKVVHENNETYYRMQRSYVGQRLNHT